LFSRATRLQGEYRQAQAYAKQALAVAQTVGDSWFLSFCHEELANSAMALGEYTVAHEHYTACHTLCHAANHPEGVARALSGLADVALERQAYAEAQQLYQQGLLGHQRVFSEGGIAYSLVGLAKVAIALNDYPTAGHYLQQALKVIQKMRSVRSEMQLLMHISRFFLLTGRRERGLELLALVLRHPASSQSNRDEAQALLAEWRSTIQPDRFAKIMQQVHSDDLSLVLEALAAELTMPVNVPDEGQTPGHRRPTQANQPLVEPLTPRELNVLQLLARGLSNQEVAAELILSVGTVKFYTGQIYGKLGVNSRTQAIVHARELQLLS
jgi:ATP/maltotriose-dependent transcriptional regulator MalT